MNDIQRLRQLSGILTESTVTAVPGVGIIKEASDGDAQEWARNVFRNANVAQPEQTRVKRAPAPVTKKAAYQPDPIAAPGDKHAVLKSRMAELDKLIGLKKQQESLSARAEKWGPLPPKIKYELDDSHYSTRDMAGKIAKAEKAITTLNDYMAMKRSLYAKKPRPVYETAPPGMEDMVQQLQQQCPDHPEKAVATAWSIYNRKQGVEESEVMFSLDDEFGDEMGDGFDDTMEPRELMDIADDLYNDYINRGLSHQEASAVTCDRLQRDHGVSPAEARSMANGVSSTDTLNTPVVPIMDDTHDNNTYDTTQQKLPSKRIADFYQLLNIYDPDQAYDMATANMSDDEITDFRSELDVDAESDVLGEKVRVPGMDNGYDSQVTACGDDYFPNGATAPVSKRGGPSGARHGDNPLAKSMEITETRRAYNKSMKG